MKADKRSERKQANVFVVGAHTVRTTWYEGKGRTNIAVTGPAAGELADWLHYYIASTWGGPYFYGKIGKRASLGLVGRVVGGEPNTYMLTVSYARRFGVDARVRAGVRWWR